MYIHRHRKKDLMLRNVLVMASSGLVLFSKEFVNSVAQPRLMGSLIAAMIEFSTKTTGVPVSYIAFTNVAVTIVTNDTNSKVFCVLFHDKSDGCAFGKLMATSMLEAFLIEFTSQLESTTTVVGHNVKDFHGFHFQISKVIRDSVKPILSHLQLQRGIRKSLFVTEDDSIISVAASNEVDQLGVLANLQSLVNLGADMMTFVGDNMNSMTLDGPRGSKIDVQNIETTSTLVVVYKKGSNESKCKKAITEASEMLKRISHLLI